MMQIDYIFSMSGTIETTNNNIIIKINSIIKILDRLKKRKIDIGSKIYDDINKIHEEYSSGSINILSDYFSLINNQKNNLLNESEKKNINDKKGIYFSKYQSFIRKESIISNLDRIILIIKHFISNTTNIGNKQELYNIIKIYDNSTINKNIKGVTYEICSCNNKMDIDANHSILICKDCGITKELYGTVFEDDQFYYQEGQRTKHGTYDPSKHCRFWVERIQARETTDIPDMVLQSIRLCIIRDKIKNKKQINCNQIRKYLSQTRNSKYNEHVPLVRKIITGVSPPSLTDYEMQLIHIYFDKVIHIFDEIKPLGKTNCPYHPYFIYKIIGQILNKKHDRIRKLKILSCIHLQSHDTLLQNDILWKLICERIPDLEYIPTDRNDQIADF